MYFSTYLYLIFAWIFFGVLHSMLAAGSVKKVVLQKMKGFSKYYRLLYSLFATAGLLFVLYFHFSCVSFFLWQPPLVEEVVAVLFMLTGIGIMLACINKYFMDLSGIDAIIGKTKPLVLQTGGMHRYVRHPLYTGTLLFVWSIFLYTPYLKNLVSCICITIYTLVGIYFEEKKLVKEYGDAYVKYQASVPELLPGRIFIK